MARRVDPDCPKSTMFDFKSNKLLFIVYISLTYFVFIEEINTLSACTNLVAMLEYFMVYDDTTVTELYPDCNQLFLIK